MGSSTSRLISCVRPSASGCGDGGGFEPGPLDETLGHSFCYVRSSSPGHSRSSSAGAGATSAAETAFRSISGASVSANSSVPLPVHAADSAVSTAGFQSSSSFSALPLQLAGAGGATAASGPLDRGFFLSGPIERGAMSGPLDPVQFSGPLVKQKRRSLSRRFRKPSSFFIKRSVSEKNHRPWVVPISSHLAGGEGVQWAHGKAGEDRVHVVISEEHRWLFIGIYDGFNGPDAPDFLVTHLYPSVHSHLRGLFWKEDGEQEEINGETNRGTTTTSRQLWQFLADDDDDDDGGLDFSGPGRFVFSLSKIRKLSMITKEAPVSTIRETTTMATTRVRKAGPITDHGAVLDALTHALESTEKLYLEMAEKSMGTNPELALIGSCLLVVLMRDDDLYVMNVGDSRAIVAHCKQQNCSDSEEREEIETSARVGAELVALQLSTDHSTSVEEEVLRIKREHPDDNHCIVNDRVKGRLKVTRAFGAGYLKQAKYNTGLLEMFRNEFIGSAPYVTCNPSLCHYKVGPTDQFLVLSSDGLYQYLTNEEVVLHVQNFMERFPDGDPAQSLIEELLFRAAKKAGMDFYELLDIPQGDRRKYHDDVTVMVISLEGRIWKSSG